MERVRQLAQQANFGIYEKKEEVAPRWTALTRSSAITSNVKQWV